MKIRYVRFGLFLALFAVSSQIEAQNSIKEFVSVPSGYSHPEIIENSEIFHGYTNYWHDTYEKWYRYGNLFKMTTPDIYLNLLQSKIDVAEDLGFPGLLIEEGFVSRLLSQEYTVMEQPEIAELKKGLEQWNVLVTVQASSVLGKELEGMSASVFEWTKRVNSHQFNATDLNVIKAFHLTNGTHDLHVVLSDDPEEIHQFIDLVRQAEETMLEYDLRKGYFGAASLLKSVTIQPGHPLDIIGKGLNEGNTWFIFDGYMDFLAKEELENWVKEVNLPVYVDVGFSPIYGCDDYEGLQVQDMKTRQSWIDYAHSKNGYAFHPVYDPGSELYEYDGYISHPGNKMQIYHDEVPFIHHTGYLSGGLTSSMVLFTEKSQPVNREVVWGAIMNRRAVAISEGAEFMGPAEFRDVLSLLYLDREFLEDYFGDRIDLEVRVEDYQLEVNIKNYGSEEVSGELLIEVDPAVHPGDSPENIVIAPGQSRQFTIPLGVTAQAMGRTNPVAVTFLGENVEVRSLTKLDLPPAISIHQLLYANESAIDFPVTIHNFGEKPTVPVEVSVYKAGVDQEPVNSVTKQITVKPRSFREEVFNLELDPGKYRVVVSALGTQAESQLGVGPAVGSVYAYEVDLNSDGIPEYRMENDSVEITLLRTGARIIEYKIKSRDYSNVLFKAWPEKTYNHNKPYRMRGYYPYGGFEDFLGQGSMETHQVYDARIIKGTGDYVQVAMETEYYGNRLKKIFTLYGNSPLVEVRYKLTFHDEDANVIGPQPILELGESHGTEDVFIVPVREGLKEYRMRMEDYYGQAIDVTEGWNAGYDTQADISFIGAFPVNQPIFLHMWMNHPKNPEAPHYYVEFQPWTPIVQKTNMYFTYYLWGAGGNWKKALEELDAHNLISRR